MPELPEVETVVRTLRSPLVGRTIAHTQVAKGNVVSGSAAGLSRALCGRRITAVDRRAKNILISLEGKPTGRGPARTGRGESGGPLLRVHLGMTGKLLFFPPRAHARTRFLCVRFRLEGGGSLVYDDVRRFGRIEVLERSAWTGRERLIGPEPLDPTYGAETLHAALGTSRSPVRSWLLDGRKVAGIGNIYANEALFLAGVRPMRAANRIDNAEAARLHEGIRRSLTRAIELGGTTLRDYVDADGRPGQYAENLSVYGREGRPCPTCEDLIERTVFGGRSAFFCPTCQS